MTKIPIFLEPLNPLPEDIDAWAELVAEQFEAALTAIEAQDACIGEDGDASDPSRVTRQESS